MDSMPERRIADMRKGLAVSDANPDRRLPAAVRRLFSAQEEASAGAGRAEIDSASPIFILCCARSGSTLLRVMLNNHREIACPPETNVPQVAGALIQMWASTEGSDGWSSLPDDAQAMIKETVSTPLEKFASKRGKRVWCDKSASNLTGAELLLELFPSARFICLYRHPMDVIASGLAASRWGFSSFGFDPYVRMSSDNLVRALAVYWYDQIAAVRRFERKHADRCTRVYYETLVSAPETTGHVLCDGLGIPWDPAIMHPDFGSLADYGNGDFKLPYSQGIDARRIGRGHAIPVVMIPPELLLVINTLLAELQYAQIGADWNTVPHPFAAGQDGNAGDQEAVDDVIALLNDGLRELRESGNGTCPLIQLNLEGSAGPLVIDTAAGRVRDGRDSDEPEMVVSTSAQRLLAVAAGENMGEAMREGDVRVVRIDALMTARAEYLIVKSLMNLLIAGRRAAGRPA
jgi:hypothetical protein